MTTKWTIRHGLMLLWSTDLMNVTEEATIHRPNVSTLLSSAFQALDKNVETLGLWIVASSVTFIKSVDQSSIKPCLISLILCNRKLDSSMLSPTLLNNYIMLNNKDLFVIDIDVIRSFSQEGIRY